MTNTFLIAGIVAGIFFIMKFIEMRVVDKESKPLKLLIRDSLVVYISVVMGDFVVDQLQPFIVGENITHAPSVFINNPEF